MGNSVTEQAFEYIRKTYGVPARKGVRVRYLGGPAPAEGTITGAAGGYIRVRLDGDRLARVFHPTWMLNYLEAE